MYFSCKNLMWFSLFLVSGFKLWFVAAFQSRSFFEHALLTEQPHLVDLWCSLVLLDFTYGGQMQHSHERRASRTWAKCIFHGLIDAPRFKFFDTKARYETTSIRAHERRQRSRPAFLHSITNPSFTWGLKLQNSFVEIESYRLEFDVIINTFEFRIRKSARKSISCISLLKAFL